MMAAGLCGLHGLFGHLHQQAAVSGPVPLATGAGAGEGELSLAVVMASAGLLLAVVFVSVWRDGGRPVETK